MKSIKMTNSSLTFLVDDDFTYPGKFYLDRAGYARHIGSRVAVHRIVTNVTDPSILVDHINRNKLDNTSANLRPVDSSQNGMNKTYLPSSTTKIKHVHLDKRYGTIRVRLIKERACVYFGVFSESKLEMATTVADCASMLYHGKYGTTTRPKEVYREGGEYDLDRHHPDLSKRSYALYLPSGEVVEAETLRGVVKKYGISRSTFHYQMRLHNFFVCPRTGILIYLMTKLISPRQHVLSRLGNT